MKAIITLGASASGKSTWAKSYIASEAEAGRAWTELNKDETRIEMLREAGCLAEDIAAGLKAWSYDPHGPQEVAMKERLSAKLAAAVDYGAFGVIFSNTNIDGGAGARAELAKHAPGAEIEFKPFVVEFETCLVRDALRKLSVGESVLRMQFEKLAALNLGFYPAPGKEAEREIGPVASLPVRAALDRAIERALVDPEPASGELSSARSLRAKMGLAPEKEPGPFEVASAGPKPAEYGRDGRLVRESKSNALAEEKYRQAEELSEARSAHSAAEFARLASKRLAKAESKALKGAGKGESKPKP